MYIFLSRVYSQQKKLKKLFVINLIITGIIYLLLLYFSVHVLNVALPGDSTSLWLGTFFVLISLFSLVQIVLSFFLIISSNKRYDQFLDNFKRYLIDHNMEEKLHKELAPEDLANLIKKASNEEDFQRELKRLLDEMNSYK